MVGTKFTFDIYRVIDGYKTPLTFIPIDFQTHPQRILRAIIAIKVTVLGVLYVELINRI